ncbi:MAG: tetratricopeptide repeat protein, partial [Thermoguttaceae bacterium]|nr:tetratricopeptide repeat protein [Thermoguttaceae bacterium]
ERFQKAMPNTSKEALWEQTAVEPLFYRMMTLDSGAEVTARCYRGDPVVRENLAPAMREILLARRLAPLDADTHLLYAVLFPLTADSPEMKDIIVRAANRAMMTSPYVAVVTFRAGALLFVTGNEEEACRLWRRSYEISSQNRRSIAKLLLHGEDTDTIRHRLEAVFPDDPNAIDQIYTEQKSSLSRQAADALLARLENILDQTADKTSGEYLHALARLNDYRGKTDESLALYDQALDIEPAHPAWLAEKADLYFREKRFDEGIAALEQALQLDPGNQKYESLAERYRK